MNDMPPVLRCDVDNCFYNRSKSCHAAAINVGGDEPICDTFVAERQHIHRSDGSQVGACHVRTCRWNQEMLCHAAGIKVAPHGGHADCATFEQN